MESGNGMRVNGLPLDLVGPVLKWMVPITCGHGMIPANRKGHDDLTECQWFGLSFILKVETSK